MGRAFRCPDPLAGRFTVVRPSRSETTGEEKSAPESCDQPLAELLAQNARGHFLDLALGKFAELKRAERDADEAGDRQSEMAEHVAHFAVLALADRESEPEIRALHAIERRLDRAVADAIDGDAGAQFVKLRCVTEPWARTR